ncbi:MAG: CCA tRNA nucleotidyltransferase [Cyanobacteria bacterium P01_F01_bin.33]
MSATRFPFPLPFSTALLPRPAYLVGGAVRDWLLGRSPTHLDLDLVVERCAIDLARALADELEGGFVILDRKRHIARVVCSNFTLDIAQQAGPTLAADLKLRDFTCNAIAIELHAQTLLDPLNGAEDIRERQLRMVHPDNLSADPLRLLRGYRQAAQLGFCLAADTRAAINCRISQLKTVAGERVRTELNYLLDLNLVGLDWLETAVADGVLRDWLPAIPPAAFDIARQVSTQRNRLIRTFPSMAPAFNRYLCDDRDALTTTTFAALLDSFAPERVLHVLNQLKYSRAETKWVQKLHTLTPQLQTLAIASRAQIYQFFQLADTWFPGIALLAIASGTPFHQVEPLIQRYEDPADPLAHQVPLLDGQQLMQAIEIPSGPLVGQLLIALKLEQAEGRITTKSDAIACARQFYIKQTKSN